MEENILLNYLIIIKQRKVFFVNSSICTLLNKMGVVETARSMIFHAKLPLKFWAEAINSAVYLHNRSPTVSLENNTPYECWFL